MKGKIETQEIHAISPELLELHPEALATPRMSTEAYEALKEDIRVHEQKDPVVVYRNKIVDGRHRWLILQELGIDKILYTTLPNNYTIAQIKAFVQSKEMRRHETPAQLAIRAYRNKVAKDSPYKSFAAAAEAIGATKSRVSEANTIASVYGRLDILDLIFDGQKFNTGTERHPFYTDSLATILKWLTEKGHPVKPAKKIIGLEPRKELSSDEQLLVTSFLNALAKESVLVKTAVANRLYSEIKGGE